MMIGPVPSEIGHYKFGQIIGRGTYSLVYQAFESTTGLEVAIKILDKSGCFSASLFKREVLIYKEIDHPLIAQLFETCEDEKFFYIVMEKCSGMTLLEYINSQGKLNEKDIMHFFTQLVSIMDYLHSTAHILHRDLKAENLMIDSTKNMKLIDFGFAKQFSEENPQTSTICGSYLYTAPEVLSGQKYSTPADVWSMGVIIYAMAESKFPFLATSPAEVIKLASTTVPIFRSKISPELQGIIKGMLEKNQLKRLTIEQIKDSQLFSRASVVSKLNFLKSPSLKVSINEVDKDNIDNNIIEFMQQQAISTDFILDELIANNFSKKTALYKLLRRNKINTLLIKEPSCQRSPLMFSSRPCSQLNLKSLGCDSIENNSFSTIRRQFKLTQRHTIYTNKNRPTIIQPSGIKTAFSKSFGRNLNLYRLNQ